MPLFNTLKSIKSILKKKYNIAALEESILMNDEKQIQQSDFKDTNCIVQSNNLIQTTRNTLNLVPLKIFKVLVSCIDTNHPKNSVTIAKRDLYKFFDYKHDNNYSFLKAQMETLQKQIIKLQYDKKEVSLSLIPKIVWEKDNDFITCYFSEDILPYLVELKNNFTKYEVMNLYYLKSKYGIIIYELLKSNDFKMQETKHTFSIEYLRQLTNTEKKYKAFKDFEKKVLQVAVNDINDSYLEILIDYEKIKRGHRIAEIKFITQKRKSYKQKAIIPDLTKLDTLV